MESLVTELVWLVTNYQAWVVGVLIFGDPHIRYRRYSFFEILALCKDAGTAPATRRKNFCFATSSKGGGSVAEPRSSSMSVRRANPSGCCAPRRSDAIALASSILTGALHVRRRIAGVFAVLVALAVIRRGWGCFAATAVAIAQLPHHHAERLRRRADHARGPGPASTGIVDLIAWLTRGAAHSSKKLGAMPVTVAG